MRGAGLSSPFTLFHLHFILFVAVRKESGIN